MREAALRRDPRALALMMSGIPALREAGAQMDTGQLARAGEGRAAVGQQFTQALQRAQEERERRLAGVEAGKLGLEQKRLEMGRWVPIKGEDGITYLYDQWTHQIVNGVVPGAGWTTGAGRPGATVTPGVGGQSMPSAASPMGALPVQAQPGGQQASASPPVGQSSPTPTTMPAQPAATPQTPTAPQMPDIARRFMELSARKQMPPEALKELDEGGRTLQAIERGLEAVKNRPQAFSASQAIEENAPFEYTRSVGRAIHQRIRSPEDTAARANVYGFVVGQMHNYFGARMTEPEFQRSALFLPGIQESPQNIASKLANAREAILARNARIQHTYMPALSLLPSAKTEEQPAREPAPVRRFTRVDGKLVEVK
jgi:hypothetical protein